MNKRSRESWSMRWYKEEKQKKNRGERVKEIKKN